MSEPEASRIFDPGMQPERTALAWRRTALAMGVGSIAALRVFPLALGPWALVPTAVAVAIAIAVFVIAQLRYRRNHRALTSRDPGTRVVLAGGGLVAIVALATLGFAVIAAVLLVIGLLHR